MATATDTPKVTNAYRLCLALLKQVSTGGTVYPKLTDPEYASLTWHLESVIPVGYDFTNFQEGDTQIETVEKNTITALTKAKKFESGVITPPTFNFNEMAPADCESVVSTLDALTDVADPFKVLLLAGVYNTVANGVRTYDVFKSCVAILTQDGGRSGEAKGIFTGALGLQACHIPIVGKTACGATLKWTTSTGKIAAVFTTSSSNS